MRWSARALSAPTRVPRAALWWLLRWIWSPCSGTRKRGPIWPRACSFYGTLLGAMEDWQHTHNPAEDDESRGKIGRLLEQKRKERGLTLEEVEQATKIRKRYLTALEHDNYAILRDAVYARGF